MTSGRRAPRLRTFKPLPDRTAPTRYAGRAASRAARPSTYRGTAPRDPAADTRACRSSRSRSGLRRTRPAVPASPHGSRRETEVARARAKRSLRVPRLLTLQALGVVPVPLEGRAPRFLLDAPEAHESGNGVAKHVLIRHLPGPAEEPPALAVLRGLDGPAVQPSTATGYVGWVQRGKGLPDTEGPATSRLLGHGLGVGRRGDQPYRLALLRASELYGRRVGGRRRLEHDLAVASVHEDGLPRAELHSTSSFSDKGSSTSRWMVRGAAARRAKDRILLRQQLLRTVRQLDVDVLGLQLLADPLTSGGRRSASRPRG